MAEDRIIYAYQRTQNIAFLVDDIALLNSNIREQVGTNTLKNMTSRQGMQYLHDRTTKDYLNLLRLLVTFLTSHRLVIKCSGALFTYRAAVTPVIYLRALLQLQAMDSQQLDDLLRPLLLPDLRKECRARGLNPGGGREALMDRVREDILSTHN